MDELIDTTSANPLIALAKTLRVRHVGLAFLWSCTLLTFRSSVLLCNCIDTMSFATLVVMMGLASQGIVMISITALAARNPSLIKRLPAWAFVGVALMGLLVMSLIGHVGYEGSHAASIVGSICAGCGYGYLCGMWAQTYGRMHPSRTSFYIPLVFLLTIALYFFVIAISEALGVQATLLMLPLPVLALWCLRAEDAHTEDNNAPLTEQSTKDIAYLGAFRSLWRLLFGGAIFAFMYGFVWQLAVTAVGSVDLAHRMPLLVSFVVGLAYAALIIFGRRKISLSVVYSLTAPVFIVVFALLPVFWSHNSIALYSAVSAGFSVFDIVIWCMVVEAAYDHRVSGFVVNGVVRGVILLAQLAGILLGYLYSITPHQPPALIIAVAIIAVYFVGLWLFVARKRRSKATDEIVRSLETTETSTSGPTKHDFEGNDATFLAHIDDVAAYYHLTRRESEVLPYLARGRSAKVIAEALFVSENTIRSHIGRILDKTDLHSKQELIDLIESFPVRM